MNKAPVIDAPSSSHTVNHHTLHQIKDFLKISSFWAFSFWAWMIYLLWFLVPKWVRLLIALNSLHLHPRDPRSVTAVCDGVPSHFSGGGSWNFACCWSITEPHSFTNGLTGVLTVLLFSILTVLNEAFILWCHAGFPARGQKWKGLKWSVTEDTRKLFGL